MTRGNEKPGRAGGRAPTDISAGQRANVMLSSVTDGAVISPERQLEAWAATVGHLHALGLPAPVPEFAAAWLRRRGIRPDWTVAS